MDYLNHFEASECYGEPSLAPGYDLDVVHSQIVTTTTTNSQSVRSFGSPKSESYVNNIRKSSIPDKTRSNTNWAVKVWLDWAESRNKNLLPGEDCFSTMLTELTLTQ